MPWGKPGFRESGHSRLSSKLNIAPANRRVNGSVADAISTWSCSIRPCRRERNSQVQYWLSHKGSNPYLSICGIFAMNPVKYNPSYLFSHLNRTPSSLLSYNSSRLSQARRPDTGNIARPNFKPEAISKELCRRGSLVAVGERLRRSSESTLRGQSPRRQDACGPRKSAAGYSSALSAKH